MERASRVLTNSRIKLETRPQTYCNFSFRPFWIQKTRLLHSYPPSNFPGTGPSINRRVRLSRRRLLSSDATRASEEKKAKFLTRAKWLNFIVSLSIAGGLTYAITHGHHTERASETGRWRKMNITADIEDKLGEDTYLSLVSQYRHAMLPDYHPITQRLRDIVNAILQANDLGTVAEANEVVSGFRKAMNAKDRRWRLAVVADETVPNSTASSGGIIVFTGLLSICKDENELAAVLGHEIAHVVARHLAERYSKARDWSLKQILQGLARFYSEGPESQRQTEHEFRQLMSSNLHEQELEADAIGLQLTARACFDPQAAITVNQRLAVVERRIRLLHPELKPTHPCSEERIEQLEHLLPKAYRTMLKSPRCNQTSNS